MNAFLHTRNIEAIFAKPRRRQTEFVREQLLLVSGFAQRQLAKGTLDACPPFRATPLQCGCCAKSD
jgi:hypothetical protein